MGGDAYCSANGHAAHALRVVVGNSGPWHAELDLDSEAELAGRVEVQLGSLTLLGTVAPAFDGSHGLQRRCRIIAGAGGWGTELPPKAYHNDAGVKAQLIAEDAARECGETIGTFVPASERVGVDYVRTRALASRALDDAAGEGVAWWCDYAGVTHVGPRNAAPVAASAYDVVAYDPRARVATLAVDDAAAVTIGSVLSEGLDVARSVRQLEIVAEHDSLRVHAWLADDAQHDRLTGLLRAIAQRATERPAYGCWRYRVVRMAGDGRVELQAVSRAAGLPDIAPISMFPGVAGAHAELALGAEVLVQFVDGDRAQPVVTAFAGKDGAGWVPASLSLCGPDAPLAARQGDAVEVLLPPATFNGTIGPPPGAPATGVLVFSANKALGTITGGSSKVRIG